MYLKSYQMRFDGYDPKAFVNVGVDLLCTLEEAMRIQKLMENQENFDVQPVAATKAIRDALQAFPAKLPRRFLPPDPVLDGEFDEDE